jgi:competence protein ComEC
LPHYAFIVALVFCVFVAYITFAATGFSIRYGQGTIQAGGQIGKCCLEVSVLDIGQGDSIYIHAPNGVDMLIDSGPPGGQVSRKVAEMKNIFDNGIDILLATHPDADHIGGFEELLQHFHAEAFIDPGLAANTATYKNLISEIDSEKIKKVVAERGMKIVLDPERKIVFEVLYPDPAFYTEKFDQCVADNDERKAHKKKGALKNCDTLLKKETNDMSIVGKLTYGNTSFMLTGDAPDAVEKYVERNFTWHSTSTFSSTTAGACTAAEYGSSKSLCSNVLKVGHHGSKNSTGEEFVKAVSPQYAAISVGATNRYGHPAERVLETLMAASSSPSILRTDKLGTIKFVSDGDTVTLVK